MNYENLSEDDLEILDDFLEESKETLSRIPQALIKLRDDPDNIELVNAMFRSIHSVKGNSAFLGLLKVKKLAHETENILSKITKEELVLTQKIIGVLSNAVEELTLILLRIEKRESELKNQNAFNTLIETIIATSKGQDADLAVMIEEQRVLSEEAENKEAPAKKEKKTLLIPKKKDKTAFAKPPEPADSEEDTPTASRNEARDVVSKSSAPAVLKGSFKVPSVAVAELRKSSSKINDLTNRLASICEKLAAKDGSSPLARMLTELKNGYREVDEALRLNMKNLDSSPIRLLLKRVDRIVENVCDTNGKVIKTHIEGEDLEIPKYLMRVLEVALIHLVRNAADHGVEEPQIREKAGKTKEGNLWVKVDTEDDSLRMVIRDDGKGIDYKALVAKVLERKLWPLDRRMTPKDVPKLIFLPGVSTAKIVTDVSGRGVGMDAVKYEVEKVGGQIKVVSRSGIGTTFSISIPL